MKVSLKRTIKYSSVFKFELSGHLKIGVKLQCLAGEGKLSFLQNIGNFKTLRVREIEALLYFTDRSEQQ